MKKVNIIVRGLLSNRGVATGVYIGIYPPPKKTAQVNFLWGKMTSERLFNSFIHPQKLLYPFPPKQISGYAPAIHHGL